MLMLSGICVVFLLFFCWQTQGFLFQDGVVVPKDPYVYIGNELVLSCNLTRPLDEDSKSMYFTRNANERIPSKYVSIVGTRSIKLRMPILSPDDSGNYVCKINKTNGKIGVLGFQVVTVDYKPQKVKKEDISCRVFNWEKMNCTWKLGVNYIHIRDIKVELVWAVASDNKQYDCPHQTNTSCVWYSDNSKDRLRWNMPYSMGILVSNEITKDQVITTFVQDTESIVQPDTVSNVVITPNSTCMTIQWNHSDQKNLKLFQVQYKSEWMQTAEVIETEEMSAVACDLKPHTWYTVEIRARPLTSRGIETGFWSEAVAHMELTKEDVPSGAPEVSFGSFAEYPCGLRFCRKVIVFWKPVKRNQSNGQIIHYHVNLLDLNSEVSIPSSIGNVTNQEFSIDINHAYKVQISAATRVGISEHAASVFIPEQSQEPRHPEEFVVEQSTTDSNEEQIDISWKHPSSPNPSSQVRSYTVYWCRGAHLIQICQETVNWKVLHPNSSEFSMVVERKSVPNMLFGISVETSPLFSNSRNWTSSGIKWNTCIYKKNGKPLIAPSRFRLSSHTEETSVKVEWDSFQCHESDGYVQKFLLFFCEAETLENCTGGTFNITVEGQEHSVVVEELDPGASYRMWMMAEAAGGVGPSTDPLYATIPVSDVQTEEIVGILVAVLVVFALTLCGVICCIRRCYHTVKSNLQPYDIVIPNVQAPPRSSVVCQESSYQELDLPVPVIPPKPPSTQKSKTKYDEEEDDDDDSIYAKINDLDSHPSSPGEGAATVPLLNKNKANTLDSDVKTNIFDDKARLLNNNACLADSMRNGVMNSAETLLCRLHPSHIAMYSYNGGKFVPNVKYMPHENVSQVFKNRTIDTAALASCSPYDCVDVTGKAYSVKDFCTRNGKVISENGTNTCDSLYLKNDLSGSPVGRKEYMTNTGSNRDMKENFNIRLTLDRRKTPDSCSENANTFNLHNSSIGDERYHINSVDNKCNINDSDLDSNQLYPAITSYCKANPTYPVDPYLTNDLNMSFPRSGGNGYVDHNQFNIQSGTVPLTDYITTSASERLSRNPEGAGNQLNVLSGTRPVSEVVNVPPHFYGSLSLLDNDGEVTEL